MEKVTENQKKIADLIIQNATLDKPLNGGEMVEKVGYGQSLVDYPKKVLDTEGVKLALKRKGFTQEGADSVVHEILYKGKKDENKLKAAEYVTKRLGGYAPEKSVSVSVSAELKLNPKAKLLKEEYEKKLLEAIQE